MTTYRRPVVRDVERIALRPAEAAAALGISIDLFNAHVRHQVKWTYIGRVRVVACDELRAFVARNAARVADGDWGPGWEPE